MVDPKDQLEFRTERPEKRMTGSDLVIIGYRAGEHLKFGGNRTRLVPRKQRPSLWSRILGISGVVAALLCLAIPASAQSVQQSGSVTPGHAVKWVIDGVVQDGGLGFTAVVNGNFNLTIDSAGHLRNVGSAPAPSSCGTGAALSGTDIAGTVTMGTGSPTGCVITFATTYASVPDCVVTWQTNLSSMIYVIAAATITLTQTGTSSNKVNYDCKAKSGG